MPTRQRGARTATAESADSPTDSANAIVAELKRTGTKTVRDGMARYAIPSDKAFGVPVGTLKKLAAKIGKKHDLALALWETGWHEARMLAAFVGEPERVTAAQMDKWRKDFDNWAVCDHACFNLFDRAAPAWMKVAQWAGLRDEFGKRAAFALLWGLCAHDKRASDDAFRTGLVLIEREAADERNFVKKAVNMALRAIGRRNAALNSAAIAVAERLAASGNATARWVGRDALREFSRRPESPRSSASMS